MEEVEEKSKEVRLSTQEFYTNIVNNCLNKLFDNGDRLKVTHAFVDGEKAWLDIAVVSDKGGSRAVIYSVECQLSVIMDGLKEAIECERHPRELNINDFVVETEDDESDSIELEKNLD